MTLNTAGRSPSEAVTSPTPARSRIAAELAERMARITAEQNAVARLLAELAATSAEPPVSHTPEGPERMWTPEQIAEAGHVAYDTVLDWIRNGELAAVRVGQRYKVPDSEWQQFIRAQLRAASALRAA